MESNHIRIILDQYFDDVDKGYGWVEYEKALTDLQIGYGLDISKEELDEYLGRANLIDVAYDGENKILIVNDNLDFELDILPILHKE